MPEFSEFERLIMNRKNELDTSVLLILVWIAASDGTIHESEMKKISDVSSNAKYGYDIQPLIALVKNRNYEAIQLACEIVQSHFRGEKGRLFLELAIGMTIADSYLLPTENHILRFLADLLGVTENDLNDLFVSITGKKMPEPSDPSKANYWQSRGPRGQSGKTNSSAGSSQDSGPSPSGNQKAESAYATLRLEFGASKEEIKSAYRRLAKVHHPDKFSSLGKETVSAATRTFQRIKDAYEYLIQYA